VIDQHSMERFGKKVAELGKSDPLIDWSKAVVPP
jgi:hypothetical protein